MTALQLIISSGDPCAPGRSVGPASYYRASQVLQPKNDNDHIIRSVSAGLDLTFEFIQCCQVLDILSIIQI